MKTPSEISFAFFGTPEIAVTSLKELERNGMLPKVVVTRPDKPQGRGNIITPSPVKIWAENKGIRVLQPAKIDGDFIEEIKKEKFDAFVLVAYGAILPQDLLDIPDKGTLNMHPSLLPHLRGPSPIKSAILVDEQPTGVTIMLIDKEMDHGPILAQEEILTPNWPMYANELEKLLSTNGARLLADTLPKWINAEIKEIQQDDSEATYCEKIEKADGLINIASGDTEENLRKIYAFEGWPWAFTYFQRGDKKIRVSILKAHRSEKGELIIESVKPEGKKEMPYEDFLRSGAKPLE